MSTSPFLALYGAVDSVGRDAGVPAHYGNPLVEQRSLASGNALVDRSNHAVLSISGEDRLSWLHSISSQSVRNLAPGESAETLLLDQTGRIEHAIKLIDDGHTLWLLTEPEHASDLLDYLQRMRFMLRVEPADRSDEFALVGCMNVPDTNSVSTSMPELLSPYVSNGVPLVWRDPWTNVVRGGHQYATTADHPGGQWHWSETLVRRSELPALVARLRSSSIKPAGMLAAEALRIAAWRPRLATEVDEKTIPHEVDWIRSAVHLSKGCYRGQETVAKVHNLGHPPRRIVMLHLDGTMGELPEPGSELNTQTDGGPKVVGRITSSAIHYELGPVALGVVRRTTDPETVLHAFVNGVDVTAAQEIIVPPSAGAEANVPRLPRLGAVTRPKR